MSDLLTPADGRVIERDQNTPSLRRIAATMRRLAVEAGAETMHYFRDSSLQISLKKDASPVTAADHAADELQARALRGRLALGGVLGVDSCGQEGQCHSTGDATASAHTKSFFVDT